MYKYSLYSLYLLCFMPSDGNQINIMIIDHDSPRGLLP